MGAATERMPGTEPAISVKEAAYAAGVSEKAVNQAIDRQQIDPQAYWRTAARAQRGVSVGDAVYLCVRQYIAPDLWPEIYGAFRGKPVSRLPRRLDVGPVTVDITRAVAEVERRVELLWRMKERVEIDREVRGGEPVFRGTRTPVYTIARKAELGSTSEELREDYPQLRDGDIELAVRYARLYPRRGRPRGRPDAHREAEGDAEGV